VRFKSAEAGSSFGSCGTSSPRMEEVEDLHSKLFCVHLSSSFVPSVASSSR
jgi:hypothetical protein